MSVEIGGAVLSAKTVLGTESSKGKDKTQKSDDADAGSDGGFPALLASLDPVAAAADPSTAVQRADNATPLTNQDVQLTPPPWSGLITPLPENMPNDLAMLLAQAGATGAKPSGAIDAAGGTQAGRSVTATTAAAKGLSLSRPVTPAGKTELPTATAVPLGDDQAGDAGHNVAAAPVLNPQLPIQSLPTALKTPVAGKVELPTATAASLGDDQAGDPGHNVAAGPVPNPQLPSQHLAIDLKTPVAGKAELQAVAAATPGDDKAGDPGYDLATAPVLSAKARGAQLPFAVGARLAESHKLDAAASVNVSAREAALSSAWVTTAMAEGLPRQLERSATKSLGFSSEAGIGGGWGQTALHAETRLDLPPAMAASSTQSLESSVAQTVSYWASQGVQNAELKLDGFGDHPVQVHISMKGDQAHIGFRTDQPEIRQILEGASAHLKELLKSEGLVLSGVSVGTSGQGSSTAQDQRPPAFARQISLANVPRVAQQSLQRVNPAVAGTVDLFV